MTGKEQSLYSCFRQIGKLSYYTAGCNSRLQAAGFSQACLIWEMGIDSGMYWANFITTEQGDDLIVSFAVAAGDFPGDILSLTLLRTPKYEFILNPDERGVSVSWEEDEDESELLLGVEQSGNKVKLDTTRREC